MTTADDALARTMKPVSDMSDTEVLATAMADLYAMGDSDYENITVEQARAHVQQMHDDFEKLDAWRQGSGSDTPPTRHP